MTLFTRITRLFSADVHSIIDSLEDPQAILKQSVRDMQHVIDQSQVQLQDLNQQHERYSVIHKKLTATRTAFKSQLDLAFAENNETLSKSLLGKKLANENQIEKIDAELERLRKQQNQQQSRLEEQQDKLKTITEKLSLFNNMDSQNWHSEFDKEVDSPYQSVVSKEDIELAYLQEKQQRSQSSSTNN